MMRSLTTATLLAAALLLGGCAVTYRPATTVQTQAGNDVHIPPGHLPPPGMCRIWYPDRPPGHQPPPGDCAELQRQVPEGAVLVHG